MARRIIEKTLDDITGEEGAGEHSFALDGVLYEIDLTDERWRTILDFMGPFVDAAPKRRRIPMRGTASASVGVARPLPASLTRKAAVDAGQNKAIRAWVGRHWRAAGLREPNPNWLAGKGSIPTEFREAYERHGGLAPRPAAQQVELPEQDVDQPAASAVPAAAFSSPAG